MILRKYGSDIGRQKVFALPDINNLIGHEAREARTNARNKYIKITDIIIFISSSYWFIDYANKMPSEITLVYSSDISVTLNNFWEHCSRVP